MTASPRTTSPRPSWTTRRGSPPRRRSEATVQLADHYDDPIRQKLADLAFVISTDLDSPYETPGEALFAILVQGAAMYTDAWVADSIAHPSGSLADAIVEATD